MVAVERSVLPEWCEQNSRKAGSTRMVAVERSVAHRETLAEFDHLVASMGTHRQSNVIVQVAE